MNRRKLFGILPLSLLCFAKATKAQPPSEGIWVEHICDCKSDPDGEQILEPSLPVRSILPGWKAEEDAGYMKEMKEFKSSPACGTRFRHLIGAHVMCPKCGHYSFAYKKGIGIPC